MPDLRKNAIPLAILSGIVIVVYTWSNNGVQIKDVPARVVDEPNLPPIRLQSRLGQLSPESQLLTDEELSGEGPTLESKDTALVTTNSSEPVFVHILGYQRTASRIISDMIADLPGQFYLYEPLAMSLTSMYGTDATYNVPTDIWAYPNGTLRDLDSDEAAAMLWTMDTIFQCNMADSWPMQFFMDQPPWFYQKAEAVANLQSCYKRKGLPSGPKMCLGRLQRICSQRYNSQSPAMHRCKAVLWKDGNYRHSLGPEDTDLDFLTPSERATFGSYFRCLTANEKQVRACARETLDTPCKKAHVRAMKTVRAPMTIPEPFFKEYPNYRMVHLFRNPRGNVNSRQSKGWALSIYERQDKVKHSAELYCKTVLSDYTIHQSLKDQYPGRSMQIISDDFMVQPMTYVSPLANLLGMYQDEMRIILTKALKANGIDYQESQSTQSSHKGALTGNARLQYWQDSLGIEKVKIIDSMCQDFFQTIPYDW